MAYIIGRVFALVVILTMLAALVAAGITLHGCSVPLVPIEDQWRQPLAFPSPADPWYGGYGGGPVHE